MAVSIQIFNHRGVDNVMKTGFGLSRSTSIGKNTGSLILGRFCLFSVIRQSIHCIIIHCMETETPE